EPLIAEPEVRELERATREARLQAVAQPELLCHVLDLLEVLNRVIRHALILTNQPTDPLWSLVGRPPPQARAEAMRPHDFQVVGPFLWSSTHQQGERNGR